MPLSFFMAVMFSMCISQEKIQEAKFLTKGRCGEVYVRYYLKLESFVKDAIVTSRPMPVSMLREQIVFNYPELALRELLMNACMHRDYQSNMPIRIYQFSNRIEILNAGGLYGEARPENFPYGK